jgi:2'-5' RNA ligase
MTDIPQRKGKVRPEKFQVSEAYKIYGETKSHEYLLALRPHEELANRIRALRDEFSEKFEAPQAKWGKPQLALLMFTQHEMLEERIINRLRTIAMAAQPFKIELKDFGSYPSHTIFINVATKIPVQQLVKEIKSIQKLLKIDKDHKPHFIEEPQMTIVRQLLPWQYEKGWLEYSQKHFTGRFIADGMLLLRRRLGEKNWFVVRHFEFQNMPVVTKQGDLF